MANNQWNNLGRNEMATREANRRRDVELPRELEHREQVREALKGKRPSRMRTVRPLLAVLVLVALAVAVAYFASR